MAKIEIVAPRRSYEVASDAKGCGSCRSYGKRLEGPKSIPSSSQRFPQLLGRAAPAHSLHSLDYC